MYLVAIGWLYVALMMAVAEANHPNGTVLGSIVTFLFYGLLPTALVMYLMGTPLRRKANREREAKQDAERMTAAPGAGGAAGAAGADGATGMANISDSAEIAGAVGAVNDMQPLAAAPDSPAAPAAALPPA